TGRRPTPRARAPACSTSRTTSRTRRSGGPTSPPSVDAPCLNEHGQKDSQKAREEVAREEVAREEVAREEEVVGEEVAREEEVGADAGRAGRQVRPLPALGA